MVGGRGVCPRQSASLDRASNSKTPGESSQGGACGAWEGAAPALPSLPEQVRAPPSRAIEGRPSSPPRVFLFLSQGTSGARR